MLSFEVPALKDGDGQEEQHEDVAHPIDRRLAEIGRREREAVDHLRPDLETGQVWDDQIDGKDRLAHAGTSELLGEEADVPAQATNDEDAQGEDGA